MEYSSNIEEEQYFPYAGISKEEAKNIRYLTDNMAVFKNGKVVQMSLKKLDKYIYANGLFASDKGKENNMSFEGYLYPDLHGYVSYIFTHELLTHKGGYSLTEIVYEDNDIKFNNAVENIGYISYRIPYPEETPTRK